jgi:hypothetical protein
VENTDQKQMPTHHQPEKHTATRPA